MHLFYFPRPQRRLGGAKTYQHSIKTYLLIHSVEGQEPGTEDRVGGGKYEFQILIKIKFSFERESLNKSLLKVGGQGPCMVRIFSVVIFKFLILYSLLFRIGFSIYIGRVQSV